MCKMRTKKKRDSLKYKLSPSFAYTSNTNNNANINIINTITIAPPIVIKRLMTFTSSSIMHLLSYVSL